MSGADGSVIFDTDLDNQALEKKLRDTTKDIEKLEKSISGQEAKKSPLVTQAEELQQRIKAARAEAAQYQQEWVSGVMGADQSESEAIARAQQLETEHADVVAQIDAIDKKLGPAYEALDSAKEDAGTLAQRLAEASQQSGGLGSALQAAEGRLQKFEVRVKSLAKRVFVFTLITAALRSLRSWMGSVVKTNSEASASIARLKGALLTLAQPLVNVIIPAFTALVNVLVRVVTVAAQVLSALFGTTLGASAQAAEALNAETEALEGTGSAAKKAGKAMASFDEINQLSGSDSSSGGGSSSSGISPDFSLDAIAEDKLQNILGLVQLIGSALLTWKLASAFHLGLKQALGLFVAIYGAIEFVKAIFDAWTNGVGWGNLLRSLAGLALTAGGLYVAFGPVASAVALLVGGLALLVTGFRDAAASGWDLENLLMTMAGLLSAGAGIAILTGTWLPLLIAGVAAALLAVTVAMGHGEELIAGVQMILQGFLDFFTGIFTGDIEKAIGGIGQVCDGLKLMVSAIVTSLKELLLSFLDWLDEKTGGRLHSILETAKSFVTAFFDTVNSTLTGILDGVKQILTGVIEFITGVFTGNWDQAWQGIKDVFRGIWNTIVTILENGINFIIRGINTFIKGINKAFEVIRGLLGYPPAISEIAPVELPRLATGAVIPPNREFMAVLGDQKQGNNLETPESLLRKIVREESGSGSGDGQTIILECDGVQFAKLVYKLNQAEGKRRGVRLAEV